MTEKLEGTILAAAGDGELACANALRIAKEANVSPKRIGELADKLKIKLRACQLGCFD